jgi:hypothetical protein
MTNKEFEQVVVNSREVWTEVARRGDELADLRTKLAEAEQPHITQLPRGWSLWRLADGRFTLVEPGQYLSNTVGCCRVDTIQPTPELLGLERVTAEMASCEGFHPHVWNGKVYIYSQMTRHMNEVPVELWMRRLPAPEPKQEQPVNADGELDGLWKSALSDYIFRVKDNQADYFNGGSWRPFSSGISGARRLIAYGEWTRTDDDPENPWRGVETPPKDSKYYRYVEGEWPDGKKTCTWITPDWHLAAKGILTRVCPPLRWRELKGGVK